MGEVTREAGAPPAAPGLTSSCVLAGLTFLPLLSLLPRILGTTLDHSGTFSSAPPCFPHPRKGRPVEPACIPVVGLALWPHCRALGGTGPERLRFGATCYAAALADGPGCTPPLFLPPGTRRPLREAFLQPRSPGPCPPRGPHAGPRPPHRHRLLCRFRVQLTCRSMRARTAPRLARGLTGGSELAVALPAPCTQRVHECTRGSGQGEA